MKVFAPILAMIFSFRAVALTHWKIFLRISLQTHKSSGKHRRIICRKVFGFTKSCREFSRQRQFPTPSFSLRFRTKDSQSLQQIGLLFGLTAWRANRNRLILRLCRKMVKCRYSLGDRAPDSPQEIFKDEAAVDRAWERLAQLGIDRSQLVKTNVASYGEYGVFFPRQIDGIQFMMNPRVFHFNNMAATGKFEIFQLPCRIFNANRTAQLPALNKSSLASGRSKHLRHQTEKSLIILGESKISPKRQSSPSQKSRLIMARVFMEKRQQITSHRDLLVQLPNWKPLPISETAMLLSDCFLQSFRRK